MFLNFNDCEYGAVNALLAEERAFAIRFRVYGHGLKLATVGIDVSSIVERSIRTFAASRAISLFDADGPLDGPAEAVESFYISWRPNLSHSIALEEIHAKAPKDSRLATRTQRMLGETTMPLRQGRYPLGNLSRMLEAIEAFAAFTHDFQWQESLDIWIMEDLTSAFLQAKENKQPKAA